MYRYHIIRSHHSDDSPPTPPSIKMKIVDISWIFLVSAFKSLKAKGKQTVSRVAEKQYQYRSYSLLCCCFCARGLYISKINNWNHLFIACVYMDGPGNKNKNIFASWNSLSLFCIILLWLHVGCVGSCSFSIPYSKDFVLDEHYFVYTTHEHHRHI